LWWGIRVRYVVSLTVGEGFWVAMGSWVEELERRGSEVRGRVEGLRQQIAELTAQLAGEEKRLSRLEITRETMEEVFARTGEADGPQPGVVVEVEEEPAGSSKSLAGRPRVGVVTVPAWEPGMDAEVLPVAYRDIFEVVSEAGQPLRAKQVATGLGLPAEASKIEGLRSKLKRLAGRGWLTEQTPGEFSPSAGTRAEAGRPPAQPAASLPTEDVGSFSVGSSAQPDLDCGEEESDGAVRHERGS
jgi:hypothetical protein